MKRNITALAILWIVFLLPTFTASQATGWKLEKKLNPDEKGLWVSMSDKEITGILRKKLQRVNRRVRL